MAYDFDRVIDRRSTESNKWHKSGQINIDEKLRG